MKVKYWKIGYYITPIQHINWTVITQVKMSIPSLNYKGVRNKTTSTDWYKAGSVVKSLLQTLCWWVSLLLTRLMTHSHPILNLSICLYFPAFHQTPDQNASLNPAGTFHFYSHLAQAIILSNSKLTLWAFLKGCSCSANSQKITVAHNVSQRFHWHK